MKLLTLFAGILTAAGLLTAADSVAYAGHDKVAAALAKGGPLANGSDYAVSGNHRNMPGEVEVHEKETDVLYVTDGAATFITGGTMVGGKQTAPGQIRGTDVKGGETHHLSKGDVIVIPAGTPHWFKEVSPQVSYYVVKIVKP